MENNNDDYSEDECNLMYSSALSVIEIFTLKNREYFKLDSENVKSIRKIKRKEKDIDKIIENIKKKYCYLAVIKECRKESHSKMAFNLDHIFDDNKRMINSYIREKSAKAKITEKYVNIELDESSEDDLEIKNSTHISNKEDKVFSINNNKSNREVEEKDIIRFNKHVEKNKSELKINKIDFDYSNKITTFNYQDKNESNNTTNDENEKEKEIKQMEYIRANAQVEIDIFTLEEIIENSKEYKGDQEFRNNLIQLKNQIQELSMTLENGIVQTNEKLDLISDDIKIADVNVDEINKNLKQAAIEKNKFNKVKYPLIFGGIGSSLGIVVPGVGSIIGGSIGTVLGYYLSKLEKKQIDKIDSDKGER